MSGGVGFGLTTCGDNAAVGMRGKQQLGLSQKSGIRIRFITSIYSSSLQGLGVHSNLIFADLG